MYRELRASKIIETTLLLQARIAGRFPESSLSRVAEELTEIAEEASERCRRIRRGRPALRFLVGLVVTLGVLAIGFLLARVRLTDGMWHIENFLEELNAALGSLVFFGAAVLFLLSVETRVKRRRALEAVSELRALAHVVDMHQLAKGPEMILIQGQATSTHGEATFTRFDLSRYLDYCSELLSLTSKIGSLYAQALPDPVALNAVDDVENLCTGLSRKIWQKIMLLEQVDAEAARVAEREADCPPVERARDLSPG